MCRVYGGHYAFLENSGPTLIGCERPGCGWGGMLEFRSYRMRTLYEGISDDPPAVGSAETPVGGLADTASGVGQAFQPDVRLESLTYSAVVAASAARSDPIHGVGPGLGRMNAVTTNDQRLWSGADWTAVLASAPASSLRPSDGLGALNAVFASLPASVNPARANAAPDGTLSHANTLASALPSAVARLRAAALAQQISDSLFGGVAGDTLWAWES